MPSIAVIGASSDRSKYGNKCVRAYQAAGWDVYPVNPSEDEIEGRPVHRKVTDVEADLDAASLYLVPPRTLRVLPELAEKGIGDVVYLNPGTHDERVMEKAAELGLPVERACSIVALGMSPAQFP